MNVVLGSLVASLVLLLSVLVESDLLTVSPLFSSSGQRSMRGRKRREVSFEFGFFRFGILPETVMDVL